MIGHTPEAYLKVKPDYYEDEFAGVYSHAGARFVSKDNYLKNCSIAKDIQSHPFLNFLFTVLGAALVVMLICLFFTCCKYRRVATQYEALK